MREPASFNHCRKSRVNKRFFISSALNAGAKLTISQALPNKPIFCARMEWEAEGEGGVTQTTKGEISLSVDGALDTLEYRLDRDARMDPSCAELVKVAGMKTADYWSSEDEKPHECLCQNGCGKTGEEIMREVKAGACL